MSELSVSKRKFLKTTAYVAPAILTLAVAPSFAAAGSGGGGKPRGSICPPLPRMVCKILGL